MTTLDEETGTPNKAGEAYMKLYNEEWRSTQNIQLENTDFVDFRGFLGDYSILIRRNDQILEDFQFSLNHDITFDCVYDIFVDKINCIESNF